MIADLFIQRPGRSRFRVRVVRLRRPIGPVARRMRAAGLPPSAIALGLRVPRRAVERVLCIAPKSAERFSGQAMRDVAWAMAVRRAMREVAA